MATVRELLKTAFSSSPKLLIDIIGDQGDRYHMTDGKLMIEHNGNQYVPTPVKVIEQRSYREENWKNLTEIELPIDDRNANNLYNENILQNYTVSIYAHDKSATDTPLIYTGKISNMHRSENKYKIALTNKFNETQKTGLTATYQIECRHDVFDSFCRASTAGVTHNPIVASVPNERLIVVDSMPYPSGFFNGGYAKTDDGIISSRIKSHNGTSIEFIAPVSPARWATKRITIYAGCSKSLDECTNKFNNARRFGGFPTMPQNSPNKVSVL